MAAVQVGSSQFADKLTKEGTELVLNGAGLREIFFVDVYSAGLYLSQKSNDANTVITMKGPKSVRLVLERDVDAADFADALKNTKAIAMLDRSSPAGAMGMLFNEVGAAVLQASGPSSKPILSNYIYGLGGRDMTRENIMEIYK